MLRWQRMSAATYIKIYEYLVFLSILVVPAHLLAENAPFSEVKIEPQTETRTKSNFPTQTKISLKDLSGIPVKLESPGTTCKSLFTPVSQLLTPLIPGQYQLDISDGGKTIFSTWIKVRESDQGRPTKKTIIMHDPDSIQRQLNSSEPSRGFSKNYQHKPLDKFKLGVCWAFSGAIALEHTLQTDPVSKLAFFRLRLMEQLQDRTMFENTPYILKPSGSTQDFIDLVNKYGYLSETKYPYVDAQATFERVFQNRQEALEAYNQFFGTSDENFLSMFDKKAKANLIALPVNLDAVRSKIQSNQLLFLALRVPERENIPQFKWGGGHSVLIYGYDDFEQKLFLQNTWGNDKSLDEISYSEFLQNAYQLTQVQFEVP
jgi:hypothetical protein